MSTFCLDFELSKELLCEAETLDDGLEMARNLRLEIWADHGNDPNWAGQLCSPEFESVPVKGTNARLYVVHSSDVAIESYLARLAMFRNQHWGRRCQTIALRISGTKKIKRDCPSIRKVTIQPILQNGKLVLDVATTTASPWLTCKCLIPLTKQLISSGSVSVSLSVIR